MSPKLGRNERCWCDSGKKYKRCCLQSDQQQMKASATVLNTGGTKNHFSHLRTVTAPASKESDTNWRRSEFSNRSTEKVARRKTEVDQLCEVALLRSVDWIEDHDAEVGGTIFLDMPEMGVEGWAEVLDIEACPELEVGNGQLITGTFKHTSGEVYDLKLESESEPIGVTAQHPFWSVDRSDWVSAIDLEIGETLKTLDGTTVVESLIQRPEPAPVYNIEVENDHVYRVGESGVLVHNASCPRTGKGCDGYDESETCASRGFTYINSVGDSWTDYVTKNCGGKSVFSGVGRRHGHHIVMKVKADQEHRELLCKYNIDPYCGCENLVIARNWCHSKKYAAKVWALLLEAHKERDKSAIEEALNKAAKLFEKCEFTDPKTAEKQVVDNDTDQ